MSQSRARIVPLRRSLWLLGVAAIAVIVLAVSAPSDATDDLPPGGTFWDDYLDTHEANIEAVAAAGITRGCNPPAGDRFCPSDGVTRGQMAAFLTRALELPPTGDDFFTDDDGSTFEADINRLAAAGITRGCNPPENSRFCPDTTVTRGQMAAFLVRALGLAESRSGDLFIDDDDTTFEEDIDRLATAGITRGCNPPANNRYCPSNVVSRSQMASFLARALALNPITPPPIVGHDPRWPHTVSILTDSVVLGAERYLPDGFPEWSFEMLGKPALMLHQVEDVFLPRNKTVGSLVAVGLGYNSLWERDRYRYDMWAERFDEQADEVIRDLVAHGALQIAWVTLREPSLEALQTEHQQDQMQRWGWYLPYVNERIRLLPARHPQVVVADWAAVSTGPGLTYDLIHLNPDGARLMTEVISGAFGF
ncbi:MAG: S-layer homology domain-containing protein [Actinomycetota bacterium]|nr:S-layer homology domain-containing protein [Actinomycetota bacterium]